MNDGFSMTHGSATSDKAMVAADRVEEIIGRVVEGDKTALRRLSIEDLAILIQFARDHAAQVHS